MLKYKLNNLNKKFFYNNENLIIKTIYYFNIMNLIQLYDKQPSDHLKLNDHSIYDVHSIRFE